MKFVSLFSLFSLASVIVIMIAMTLATLSYFGIIDKNGRVALIANEVIANQTGLPLEEIEKIEGVGIKEAK